MTSWLSKSPEKNLHSSIVIKSKIICGLGEEKWGLRGLVGTNAVTDGKKKTNEQTNKQTNQQDINQKKEKQKTQISQ